MRKSKGRSFVTIMLVVALSALGLRIAIGQLLNLTVSRNESEALETLKLISVALENYAKNNKGAYPDSLSALTKTTPPYIDRDYSGHSPFKGYQYACPRLWEGGYQCSAVPSLCGITGNTAYSVTTGGLAVSEKCGKT
jgi:type II secretory pathway pseudopilin PulG